MERIEHLFVALAQASEEMKHGMSNTSHIRIKNNVAFIIAIALIGSVSTTLANDSTDPKNEPVVISDRQVVERRQNLVRRDQLQGTQIQTADNRHDRGGTDGSASRTEVAEEHAKESTPIQFEVASLFAAGGSNAGNDELRILQGGKHDPRQNGFTLQGLDVSFSSSIDPRFEFRGGITAIVDAEEGSVFELEELYLITKSLPQGLQLKVGQYFVEFGHENALHPHDWDFVDRPFILTRLFGADSLTSKGVRVAWRTPTSWDSQVLLGMMNSKGEEQISFFGEPGDEVGGHTLISRDVRDAGDLLYLARWINEMNISAAVSSNLGISGLWGPNASGTTTDTSIYGADVHFAWRSPHMTNGPRFVRWDTEVLRRRYEAGDPGGPSHELLRDWGLFTQVLWKFRPDWIAGLRLEYANANGNNASDPQRDKRKRLSPNLTWSVTEYSQLRIQYNRDWAEHLPGKTANALWLQLQFSTGDPDDHER